ncbi:MAG: hypothetical protein HOI95_15040 [Chromatiales bacterium]|nr:hypothetical protein [Chromatiales bacterium]
MTPKGSGIHVTGVSPVEPRLLEQEWVLVDNECFQQLDDTVLHAGVLDDQLFA